MQNLQTYQIEDAVYELDTYYNIGARSRFRIVGIVDVNSTIFFICEREDGPINVGNMECTINTHNFIYYALLFHHKAKIAAATQE
jgi:hypothetical protein